MLFFGKLNRFPLSQVKIRQLRIWGSGSGSVTQLLHHAGRYNNAPIELGEQAVAVDLD